MFRPQLHQAVRCLQGNIIPNSHMTVIDSPGFYSSEEVTGHIDEQLEAFHIGHLLVLTTSSD